MSGTPAPLFPGHDSNAVIEFIARSIFPELEGEGASDNEKVARRTGDVRDVLKGHTVATLSPSQHRKIGIAAALFRLPR